MANYVWQRCLNVGDIDATGYHDNSRPDLVEMLDIQPRRALDIGCAAGGTGAYLKARFPECRVWGIELNRAAADKARERLDHVLVGKFEEIDLDAAGIEPASLDLVLVADVLEHMYDPWSVMLRIKKYLSPSGRLIISVPNIRYLPLLDDLAHGYWRYADFGVLDITHLRFFTRRELLRFLHETGFSAKQFKYGIDQTLQHKFETYRAQLPCKIETDKLVLNNVDEQELFELFSGQFFVLAAPGSAELKDYMPPKMGCYFWRGEQTDYEQYLRQHQMTRHEATAFDRQVDSWLVTPLVEVFVLVNEHTVGNLALTINSLAGQLYSRFRVTVLGEGGAPEALSRPGRIRWIDHGGEMLKTLNQHVAQSIGDWIWMLQAGDQLLPQALVYLAEFGHDYPEIELCYVDEDSFGESGVPCRPYFKPDFSPECLESFPYIGDGFAMRVASWNRLGGMTPELGDAASYALQLQLLAKSGCAVFGHVADVHFRRHPQRSLSGCADGLQKAHMRYAQLAGVGEIRPGRLPASIHQYRNVPPNTSVCLLIEVSESIEGVRILLENIESLRQGLVLSFVVLLQSELPPDSMRFLKELDEAGGDFIQVFPPQPGLSRAALRNAIINQVDAEYCCFFPQSGKPVEPDWLKIMLAAAIADGVAAVAPRLIDAASGKLVGNGLLLGCGDVIQGEGAGCSHDDPGYFGRLLLPHNPGALSLDCLLLNRSVFLASGGFAELANGMAEIIDLEQKFRSAGMRLVWTPFASVFVDDVVVPGLDESAAEPLMSRWLPQLARDPSYNVNFSRLDQFKLAEKPQVSRLRLPWRPLPILLAFPGDNMGCGHYRIIEPFNAAMAAGQIDGYCGFDHYTPFDLACFEPDTLLLQRQLGDGQLAALKNYKRFFKSRLVYELDDLITNIPVRSLHKAQMAKDVTRRLREGVALCDRFIVSTQALAEAYSDYHHDIIVMPNTIDMTKWGHLNPERQIGRKPRVGWAGGISHTGDLALVIDVVKELAAEVEWIFFGMCPDEIRPLVAEFHVGVPTLEYPAKLASLNLDLAIAPIEHNDFNMCKSNLKLLEYGALGFPVIASDFGPYQCGLPVTLVRNRFKDWVNAIREHVADLDECARRGDALREVIRSEWALQGCVDDWRRAWFDFGGR